MILDKEPPKKYGVSIYKIENGKLVKRTDLENFKPNFEKQTRKNYEEIMILKFEPQFKKLDFMKSLEKDDLQLKQKTILEKEKLRKIINEIEKISFDKL